ncbi:hypothetical protein [Streptomyces sp. NBC_01190]|uniref:hypothetical protein n=1 Tax=Streptomyces sp. NBC_01190 TaxID=2903767 RepID=UPI00386EA588|nr:hypothetical protein OG519_15580 [Streptomyces sp. NBC_01190]
MSAHVDVLLDGGWELYLVCAAAGMADMRGAWGSWGIDVSHENKGGWSIPSIFDQYSITF